MRKEDFAQEKCFVSKEDFVRDGKEQYGSGEHPGMCEVKALAEKFGVENIYLIKPGIGETTRVLLRRVPWKVFIDPRYLHDPAVAHIIRLARDKNVPVEEYPLLHYKTCGIIETMADT